MKLKDYCRRPLRWLPVFAGFLALPASLSAQQEVGFIEKFALAEDRAEALKQLIPGTEDYYYYHALHFQNERNLDELNRVMGEWKARFLKSQKRKVIENREALIGYSDAPKITLEYLRQNLGLSLNHQQEGKVQKANHPSQLDPKFVSWEAFLKDALNRSGSVGNLDHSGLYRFLESKPKLTTAERRKVLAALTTPDAPGLVDLILLDLKSKESRGFGEFSIHRMLTKLQLDQLLLGHKELLNNKAFVSATLVRLLPSADESIASSIEVREAYLDRAEALVSSLPVSFNSLKAHIRYQRLVHDRALGQESEKRLLAYLSLPRNVSYLNAEWREREPNLWRYPANLGEDFRGVTSFPPVSNGEEALVKSYLLKFLKNARNSEKFAPYLRESWLRRVFAEAKITQGVGKPSDWAALLSPSEFQSLKDRVDIEFDPTSAEIYASNDDVSFSVHLKNVPKLIVKVFEINTLNYYRRRGDEVSTDIDLDGLVANSQEVFEYNESPQLRTKRDLKIEAIPKRRGLWVVELIGGGKSSRAVIRKGALGILNKTSSSGEVVTILDEGNQPLENASLWLGGKQYQGDEKGRVLIPFSNNPGVRSILVQDGEGFTTMAKLRQPAESYRVDSGMYLEREALRTGGKAKLIVRPTLRVAGETISLSNIESASLTLSSTNLDGLPASTIVENLKLASDRDFVHEFRVPDRLTELTATLRVKVKIASRGGQEVELTDVRKFKVNEMLRGDQVADLYLSKIGGKYRVEYLGRNGEAMDGQNLSVTVQHPHFKNQRVTTLKTSKSGGVDLGALSGITQIKVMAGSSIRREWTLKNDRRDHSSLVTLAEGGSLKVPFVGRLNRREVALFSHSRAGYLGDEFSRLRLVDGYLTAKLASGDYRLLLKASGEEIKVLVAKGEISQGHVFNEARMLELSGREPSHLKAVKANAKTLEIDVASVDPFTRVHVIGTRFVPGFDPFAALSGSQRSVLEVGKARYLPSLYISGRKLGDELRYILERRYVAKFPGNMLTRPEILLNPWAVRDTESGEELLEAGDRYLRKPVARPTASRIPSAMRKRRNGSAASLGSPSYEFLADRPVLITNLIPDAKGKISINLDAFGDRQHVHVLLVDPDGSTYRSISLADRETGIRDLRLSSHALDPKRHFTEKDQVSLLKKGDSLKIPDLLNAQFEVYDHLGAAYRYFQTLRNNPVLREFAFVANWASLSNDEKRSKYSEFACHELSFFLSRKDPAFFKEVVLPHLANKKDLTFMDEYLLSKPLAKYFEPYEYGRLNVVERILLADGDPKRLAALRLDLENRLALEKADPEESRRLFLTAVQGGAFGDTYAGEKAERMAVVDSKSVDKRLSGALGGPGQGGGGGEFRSRKSESKWKSAKAKKSKAQDRALEQSEELVRDSLKDGGADPFAADDGLPELSTIQHYRALEPTKEWAENNYYQLRIQEQTNELVKENRFWLDLASHGLKSGFGSRYLGEASGNFTEMMFALSFVDLPFQAPEHKDSFVEGALNFTAGGNVLFFYRKVEESGFAEKRPPLLVSQSYFQLNDRFRMEGGQKVDKFISEEFVRGVVYGAQVVVTNPTSSRQRLDILSQIPKGAIPVKGQRMTATQPVELQPYSTHRRELAFYFPMSGEFPIYPAHLSMSGEVVAHADTLVLKVVDEPSKVDETSWAWMSQWGKEEAVLKFLATENLHAIDLGKIAWRCRENAEFFRKTLSVLGLRGFYHGVLQGYAVVHNDKEALRDLLLMQGGFLNQCGVALECDLVTIDPIQRRRYEHLEYKPLINNRAHSLGGENRILNPVVRNQYLSFLEVLSQRKALDDRDRLGVTYYLFLQDRVSDALAHLGQVKAGKLETKMQFDYFQAYAAFYEADLVKARRFAKKYETYPVDHWRDRFAALLGQIEEIEGAAPGVIEEGNREQEQQLAASKEPALELKVEGVQAILNYRNIKEVTVNYYEMDLEFLFSTNPFVSSDTSRFDVIRPNQSQAIQLAKGKKVATFKLPAKYQSSNVIVEILGGGKKVSTAVYANELKTSLSETMGLLTVRHGKSGKPLPKVYVKVYADTPDGAKFFKDGYTDLRGKFDYASVSTQGLGEVRKFSILVMSEEDGAVVLEARAPQR